ncbi:MAG: hypothetical protein KatS3mg110_2459 [Pirellulaceae bacterium]|nr:MAG: hypothetical protein KatS3mg110_2459 [Pirellulaceae bacterium]
MSSIRISFVAKWLVGVVVALPLFFAIDVCEVRGQAGAARRAASELLEAVARYFGKQTAEEGAEALARVGGRKLAEEAAERLVREAGEESLERLTRMAARHGPDALLAVRNTAKPSLVLRWVDELGDDQLAKQALRRLSAGQQGQRLARLAETHGAAVLRAEAAHPGVALRVVEHLGDDGLRLAQRLDNQQLRLVAPHVEDIARLPPEQRQGVLRLLYDDTKRMVEFIGRFVEKNPGKTLFTLGTVTVLLANPEAVFGGSEITYDIFGRPHVVEKKGPLGRFLDSALSWLLLPVKILGGGLAIFVLWKVASWTGFNKWLFSKRQKRAGSK